MEIVDKIVVTHSEGTLSYIFNSILGHQILDLFITYLNNEFVVDIFTILEQTGMVIIHSNFRIIEASKKTKY
jgi:hypothetical protein